MTRSIVRAALAMTMCLAVSIAYAQPRGKGGGRPAGGRSPVGGGAGGNRAGGARPGGGQAPGGAWSARTHGGPQFGGLGGAAGRGGGAGAPAGLAAANRRAPQASGAQGAAAGAAASNRRGPQATGAQGAAAGALASNRNNPQATGAQGAAAGAAAANRNDPTFSGAEGAAAGYAAVRGSVDHPNIYGQQWYGDHPHAWAATGWAAGAAWRAPSWDAVAAHCGYGAEPTSYNYGVNVTYQDGAVAVDGQNVGTAEEYSQQASDLAATGAEPEEAADAAAPADAEQWLPVGVFAMVRNEQQHPQLIMQLAINQQGILRGNYTDDISGNTLPIHGAVDKTTQRAAWTVGDNKQTVMEAGLADLTKNETPALIHKNGKTDHWLLVRLDQPAGAAGEADDPGTAK